MKKYVTILLLAFSGSALALADYLNCPCKVVKVTDGDTVHVLDQKKVQHKIRFGGIDAPERKQAFCRRESFGESINAYLHIYRRALPLDIAVTRDPVVLDCARHVRILGEETVAALDYFYAPVDHHFQSGKMGGVRHCARRLD